MSNRRYNGDRYQDYGIELGLKLGADVNLNTPCKLACLQGAVGHTLLDFQRPARGGGFLVKKGNGVRAWIDQVSGFKYSASSCAQRSNCCTKLR